MRTTKAKWFLLLAAIFAPLSWAGVSNAPTAIDQTIKDIMAANDQKTYAGTNCYVQVEHFDDTNQTYIIMTTELGWAFLPFQQEKPDASVTWSLEGNVLKATRLKNNSLYMFFYDPTSLQLTRAFLHVPGHTNIDCRDLNDTTRDSE